MKKLLLTSAAVAMLAAIPLTASAKTANWSVPPQYNEMEQLVPGAYKVKRGIYTGVIDATGKEILPMTTDSITPFVSGQALVLAPAQDGAYRLMSILHDDLTASPVYDEVWVEDYPFFSEGLLPVRNDLGFYGYMDPQGRMVLQPAYINIHPFSEGYAAVSKRPRNKIGQFLSKGLDKLKEQFKKNATITFVNRAGAELKTQKSIGKIVNASTFNNGVSLIQNKDGNFYLMNTQGAVVRQMPASSDYGYDDRYVYIDDNYDEHPFNADYLTTKVAQVDNSVRIFKDNKKYGFRTSSDIVLPAQFDDADLFFINDGSTPGIFAMACSNGKWGILRLDEGDFTCEAPEAAKTTKRTKSRKKTATVAKGFKVSVPTAFEKATLTLTLDASGTKTTDNVVASDKPERTFNLAKPAGDYTAEISTNNLVVYRKAFGTIAQTDNTTDNTPRLRIMISPSVARADINDNAIVTVTVTNPSSEPVATVVKISGKGLNPVNRTVTIPANGSRRISTAFTKVYERESRYISVSASGITVNKNITVNPFFVKL